MTDDICPKQSFLHSAKQLIAKARSMYPGKPFRIMSDLGELVILPPTFADEIRNSPNLSFGKATEKVWPYDTVTSVSKEPSDGLFSRISTDVFPASTS